MLPRLLTSRVCVCGPRVQVLAQMVLTELGKAWKALGAGEKATYEESAKEEKALVQKAAQSEARFNETPP